MSNPFAGACRGCLHQPDKHDMTGCHHMSDATLMSCQCKRFEPIDEPSDKAITQADLLRIAGEESQAAAREAAPKPAPGRGALADEVAEVQAGWSDPEVARRRGWVQNAVGKGHSLYCPKCESPDLSEKGRKGHLVCLDCKHEFDVPMEQRDAWMGINKSDPFYVPPPDTFPACSNCKTNAYVMDREHARVGPSWVCGTCHNVWPKHGKQQSLQDFKSGLEDRVDSLLKQNPRCDCGLFYAEGGECGACSKSVAKATEAELAEARLRIDADRRRRQEGLPHPTKVDASQSRQRARVYREAYEAGEYDRARSMAARFSDAQTKKEKAIGDPDDPRTPQAPKEKPLIGTAGKVALGLIGGFLAARALAALRSGPSRQDISDAEVRAAVEQAWAQLKAQKAVRKGPLGSLAAGVQNISESYNRGLAAHGRIGQGIAAVRGAMAPRRQPKPQQPAAEAPKPAEAAPAAEAEAPPAPKPAFDQAAYDKRRAATIAQSQREAAEANKRMDAQFGAGWDKPPAPQTGAETLAARGPKPPRKQGPWVPHGQGQARHSKTGQVLSGSAARHALSWSTGVKQAADDGVVLAAEEPAEKDGIGPLTLSADAEKASVSRLSRDVGVVNLKPEELAGGAYAYKSCEDCLHKSADHDLTGCHYFNDSTLNACFCKAVWTKCPMCHHVMRPDHLAEHLRSQHSGQMQLKAPDDPFAGTKPLCYQCGYTATAQDSEGRAACDEHMSKATAPPTRCPTCDLPMEGRDICESCAQTEKAGRANQAGNQQLEEYEHHLDQLRDPRHVHKSADGLEARLDYLLKDPIPLAAFRQSLRAPPPPPPAPPLPGGGLGGAGLRPTPGAPPTFTRVPSTPASPTPIAAPPSPPPPAPVPVRQTPSAPPPPPPSAPPASRPASAPPPPPPPSAPPKPQPAEAPRMPKPEPPAPAPDKPERVATAKPSIAAPTSLAPATTAASEEKRRRRPDDLELPRLVDTPGAQPKDPQGRASSASWQRRQGTTPSRDMGRTPDLGPKPGLRETGLDMPVAPRADLTTPAGIAYTAATSPLRAATGVGTAIGTVAEQAYNLATGKPTDPGKIVREGVEGFLRPQTALDVAAAGAGPAVGRGVSAVGGAAKKVGAAAREAAEDVAVRRAAATAPQRGAAERALRERTEELFGEPGAVRLAPEDASVTRITDPGRRSRARDVADRRAAASRGPGQSADPAERTIDPLDPSLKPNLPRPGTMGMVRETPGTATPRGVATYGRPRGGASRDWPSGAVQGQPKPPTPPTSGGRAVAVQERPTTTTAGAGGGAGSSPASTATGTATSTAGAQQASRMAGPPQSIPPFAAPWEWGGEETSTARPPGSAGPGAAPSGSLESRIEALQGQLQPTGQESGWGVGHGEVPMYGQDAGAGTQPGATTAPVEDTTPREEAGARTDEAQATDTAPPPGPRTTTESPKPPPGEGGGKKPAPPRRLPPVRRPDGTTEQTTINPESGTKTVCRSRLGGLPQVCREVPLGAMSTPASAGATQRGGEGETGTKKSLDDHTVECRLFWLTKMADNDFTLEERLDYLTKRAPSCSCGAEERGSDHLTNCDLVGTGFEDKASILDVVQHLMPVPDKPGEEPYRGTRPRRKPEPMYPRNVPTGKAGCKGCGAPATAGASYTVGAGDHGYCQSCYVDFMESE